MIRAISGGPRQSGRRITALVVVAALLPGVCGCARFTALPEWNPDKSAPAAVTESWIPPQPAAEYRPSHQILALSDSHPPAPEEAYDVAGLIDLALSNNPHTRHAWETARTAAARLGRARSAYYPALSVEAETGYQRFLFQHDPAPFQIKQWEFSPAVNLNYVLLDFGRRAQSAAGARQRLVAANFLFNRAIQDVIFAVHRAYYELDAANAMVRAAERNLEQAESVRAAAQERLAVGLATRPDFLLARQVQARAVYDAENAKVMVSDAQADLALTLGLPANRSVKVASLIDQPLPPELDVAVDELIDAALAQRPDLAARLAELRAREAAVERAQASLFPRVGLEASYGQDVWRYTIDVSPTDSANQPTYGAFLRLDWDVFQGFDRLNAIRAARTERDAMRAELAQAGLETVGAVWKAYYRYRAAEKKYAYAQALLLASEQAYESAFESYQLGLSTIVELLTSERDLAAARFTLVQTRAELLTSSAALAYAAGAMQAESPP